VFLTGVAGSRHTSPLHSFIADKMSRVPTPVTDAIRASAKVPEAKLGALAEFTRVMVATRGLPSRADVAAFLAAGFTERQILYIVLAISVKTPGVKARVPLA
jgi:alkylhydroperoxidase family enzyme